MRLLSLSGLGFVACFLGAVGLYGDGAGSDPGGIAAYYASDANRLRQIGGFAVLLLGCVLLLVYSAVVARTLVHGELAWLVLASGAGSALLLAVADALWAGSAFAAEIETGYRVPAGPHVLLEDTAFAVVVAAMAVAIPFVAASALAGARAGRLPRWHAALGVVAVAGLAAAYWYWPLAAYLLWVASGSVLLLRSPSRGERYPEARSMISIR